jgi:hypothetical protein
MTEALACTDKWLIHSGYLMAIRLSEKLMWLREIEIIMAWPYAACYGLRWPVPVL